MTWAALTIGMALWNVMGHLAATSAMLNGVAIPGRAIERTIATYAFNVFILTDHRDFPVIMRGTGTAIRFRGKELFVCTQHQLKAVELEKVGMMTAEGSRLVTSGGTRYFTLSDQTDGHDLIAFNFTEPVAAFPELRSRFYNLRWPDHLDTEVIAYIVTGCATDDQNYDVAANNHIEVARRSVLCDLAEAQPNDTALLGLSSREPLQIDPDGMSGGSVFVVHRDGAGYWVDFAGVVIQGNREGFRIIKAAFVHRFLETCTWA